ncbi:MAG: 4Fe-4S binding protein [Alicyclobacillus sp.]|nr:4Fe-4S binding protein [Alicyclobacillus sp.]
MPYIITAPCIGEKAAECVLICPVDGCIQDAGNQYVIDPDTCIECGSCQSVCPVSAIFRDDELPLEYAPYREFNAQFFTRRGSC